MLDSQLASALTSLIRRLRHTLHELEGIEPAQIDFAGLDLALRSAFLDAEAIRRYIDLHRPAVYAAYDPLETLERYSAQLLSGARCEHKELVRLVGDAAQMVECVKLVRENIEMNQGAHMMVAVFLDSEHPRIAIGVEGMGRLVSPLKLGDLFALSLEDFQGCWAAACQGGYIERDGQTVSLHLEGDAPIPQRDERLARAMEPISKAARRLLSWRGATGMDEPAMASAEESKHLYTKAAESALEYAEEALARLE